MRASVSSLPNRIHLFTFAFLSSDTELDLLPMAALFSYTLFYMFYRKY